MLQTPGAPLGDPTDNCCASDRGIGGYLTVADLMTLGLGSLQAGDLDGAHALFLELSER